MERFLSLTCFCRKALPLIAAFSIALCETALGDVLPYVSQIGASQDTYICDLYPTTNYGGNVSLPVLQSESWKKRSLLQFDVSAIPYSPLKVELYLYSNEYGPSGQVEVYALLQPWSAAQATWNNRLAGTPWSSPGLKAGVDYRAAADCTAKVSSDLSAKWYVFDITNLAEEWRDGSLANHGLLLTSSKETYFNFASSEYATAGFRPYLKITYPNLYDVVLGDFPQRNKVYLLQAERVSAGSDGFYLYSDGNHSVVESNLDLYLKPVAGAKIVPCTLMEFADFLGDKIRFYSHSYSIGVSPFTLNIMSDQDIKFHSDTSPDMMVILGDYGDVQVKRDLQAGRNIQSGGVYKFLSDTTGDKYLLYGTLYRLAISANTFDSYSDQLFKWHSDTNTDAMTLNANSGELAIEGTFTAAGKIRSNAGFNVNGTDGVSGTISPASTIVVTNGIVTGFY